MSNEATALILIDALIKQARAFESSHGRKPDAILLSKSHARILRDASKALNGEVQVTRSDIRPISFFGIPVAIGGKETHLLMRPDP